MIENKSNKAKYSPNGHLNKQLKDIRTYNSILHNKQKFKYFLYQ